MPTSMLSICASYQCVTGFWKTGGGYHQQIVIVGEIASFGALSRVAIWTWRWAIRGMMEPEGVRH